MPTAPPTGPTILPSAADVDDAARAAGVIAASAGNHGQGVAYACARLGVSRYAEIVKRSLVHEGRKHYFLVNFPQEPGALRRFLDEVLGPDDDITLFEYVKRANRETGPALVGVELGDPATLDALLARMAASPMRVEAIDPGSAAYRFLVAP